MLPIQPLAALNLTPTPALAPAIAHPCPCPLHRTFRLSATTWVWRFGVLKSGLGGHVRGMGAMSGTAQRPAVRGGPPSGAHTSGERRDTKR